MSDSDRRERARQLLAFGRSRDGEALAQPPAPGVDAQLPAGLGVDEVEKADVRELLLARVANLDGDDVVLAGELKQRPAPVARPSEVGDDHDERALARERAGAAERVAEGGPAPALPLGLATQRGQQPDEADTALAGRNGVRLGAAERHDAQAVAAPGREMPDRDRDALRDIGLSSVGGAERPSTERCRERAS